MRLDTSPATHAVTVVPSDTTDLDTDGRGFIVGVAGDVKVTTADGSTVVLPAMAAGIVHPIAVKRIWATLTTATGIVAVW